VYALWLIRPEVSSPKAIADGLRACRDNNLRELESLIAAEDEFSPDFCQFYLRECIRYQYGAPEKEGLSMFRKLCEKHGILWHDSRLII
jgi:predicted solute-binding protein